MAPLEIESGHALETFTVTVWGEAPAYERIFQDFPNLVTTTDSLKRLKERLLRFG